MPRPTQDISYDDHGDEIHPSFGMVVLNRTSSTPGASLFDSELRHQHYITLRVETASRKRDLNRDWIHGGKQIIEIAMSEAQWAQAISSLNSSGVPCTISYTREDGLLPEPPFSPRAAISRREVREAANKIFEHAMEKLAEYEAHPTKAGLRALRLAMEHSASNAEYAAKSLDEHAESTVAKARADIEAMVMSALQRGVQLELGSTFDGAVPELTAHEDEEVL